MRELVIRDQSWDVDDEDSQAAERPTADTATAFARSVTFSYARL